MRSTGRQLGPHREAGCRVGQGGDHPAVQRALQVQMMRFGVQGDLDHARRRVDDGQSGPAVERGSLEPGPKVTRRLVRFGHPWHLPAT